MLLDLLNSQLGGDALKTVSRQLGIDESTASTAIAAALPMLIGGLARNAATPQGADSLANAVSNDHDGSIFDQLGSFLRNPGSGSGDGILGHVFGGRRSHVENAVAQSSGLDAATVSRLLAMLAPIVMGGLGKVQRESELGARDMAGMLQRETARVRQASPMGGLLSLLDADGDGSVVDDVAGILGKFLK